VVQWVLQWVVLWVVLWVVQWVVLWVALRRPKRKRGTFALSVFAFWSVSRFDCNAGKGSKGDREKGRGYIHFNLTDKNLMQIHRLTDT